MWFSQYGRQWDGPWFLFAPATILYAAGIMHLQNLAAALLMIEDRDNGRIVAADR